MNRLRAAAVCVAGLLCAPAAHAATIYQFDFITQGFGKQPSGDLNNITIRTLVSSDDLHTMSDGSLEFGGSLYSFSLSNAGASLTDRSVVGRVADDIIAANACFAGGLANGAPALGFFTADPACGVASISLNGNTSSNAQTSYAGAVRAIQISIGAASQPAPTIIIPGVPEPSTWALMLTGFGLVGYALRKRSRVAFA